METTPKLHQVKGRSSAVDIVRKYRVQVPPTMQDTHDVDGRFRDPIENAVRQGQAPSGARASLHRARVPTEVESEFARRLY